MKNEINYFYQLTPEYIHQRGKEFFFTFDGYEYQLVPYNRNLEEIKFLNELTMELHQKGLPCHQFILNTSNHIITYINGQPYVLMKIYYNNREKIRVNDLEIFTLAGMDIKSKTLTGKQWDLLWSEKIDYLEYQISQIGKQYPLIRHSFSYFVGLAETAILFFKTIEKKENVAISHIRIHCLDTVMDLYNPLNFVVDYRMRDAAEFFKSKFFNSGENIAEELFLYIQRQQYSGEECLMLFARLLFPTFYFDAYDRIIQKELDEKEILFIVNKVKMYERFLKEVYLQMKKTIRFIEIEWLSK